MILEDLEAFLGDRKGRRVSVLGIGSPIRQDDAVGLLIIDILENSKLGDTLLIKTETVPESYTGTIRDFNPTHVIMIDAADFGGKAGESRIIPINLIGGVTISTHSLPLHIFADFIRKSIHAKVALIGIQVINIDYGEGLTPDVEKGAYQVAELLKKILEK